MAKQEIVPIVVRCVAGAIVLGAVCAPIRANFLHRQLAAALLDRNAREVEIALAHGADPNDSNIPGYSSALIQAASIGPPETVRALLNAGASANAKTPDGCSAVCAAVTSYQIEPAIRAIVQDLRSKGANLESRDSLGFTPLLRAAWTHNAAGVRVLLDDGADATAKNDQGQDIWTFDSDPVIDALHHHGILPQPHKQKPTT